jgi:flagellar basal-body rod protein FlgC
MSENGLFGMMSISASGLRAQRTTMNAIAENLANIATTKVEEGGPYSRNEVQFRATEFNKKLNRHIDDTCKRLLTTHHTHLPESVLPEIPRRGENGSVLAEVVKSDNPGRLVYEPTHPDADENGYVLYPDINIITEMVNMMAAARAYEANAAAIDAAKTMAQKALEI